VKKAFNVIFTYFTFSSSRSQLKKMFGIFINFPHITGHISCYKYNSLLTFINVIFFLLHIL